MTQALAAPAKINLALHVGAVRADGYHPVETLCAFLDAGDRVRLGEPGSEWRLTIEGPSSRGLSVGSDNLVLRAAAIMSGRTGVTPRSIVLHKETPVASGIGGGTANGAAAMVLLNAVGPRPLDGSALIEAAEGLGADGPICVAAHLYDRPLLRAAGIGERIGVGPTVPPFALCLANPRRAVSTGAVFSAFDAAPPPGPLALNTPAGLPTLSALAQFIGRTRNDLQGPAAALCPIIATVTDEMSAQPGSLVARMSGSGATVFGIFADRVGAARAAQRLAAYGWWTASGGVWQGKA